MVFIMLDSKAHSYRAIYTEIALKKGQAFINQTIFFKHSPLNKN